MKQIHFYIILFLCLTSYIKAQNAIVDAINIGLKTSSFEFTDTRNTDNPNLTNVYGGTPMRDVVYKFEITIPMDIIISHAGSIVEETYVALLKSNGSLYTSGYGYLNLTQLPAGMYYIISKGKNQDGIITTNVQGFTQKTGRVKYSLGTITKPFLYTHTENTIYGTNYYGFRPTNDVFYKFTLQYPMNITVTHEDSPHKCTCISLLDSNLRSLRVESAGCNNPDEYPVLQYENLPAGTYYVVSEGALTEGIIKTTIMGRSLFQKNLGIKTSSFNYTHTQDTKECTNAWNQSSVNNFCCEITTNQASDFYISHLGSELQNTRATLLNATNNEQIWSKEYLPGNNTLLEAKNIPAGRYYVISEGLTENGVITTSIYVDMIKSVITNSVRTKNYLYHPEAEYQETVEYFNGLGYLSQTIQKNQTPSKKDVIQFKEYDIFGRENETWLPAISKNNENSPLPGSEQSKAISTFIYNDWGIYSKPVYEQSPLNRVVEQYGPGQAWHTKNKAVRTSYLINNSTLTCRLYTCSDETTTPTITKRGNYATGELYVTRLEDEEEKNITYEFTNKSGQVVLTRQLEGTTSYDTYYIYDSYGNLRAVLPPLASDALSADGSWTETNATLQQYAYLYTYDHRNRCIAKKLPGAGWSYYVYDKANRLILSQDSEQRDRGEWLFMIPDALGRPILTGTCKNTLEYTANSLSVSLPKATWTGADNKYKGYEVSAITLTEPVQVLSVNYYDNYDFLTLPQFSGLGYVTPAAGYGTRYTERYTGLLTGSYQTAAADEAVVIGSAFYYDDRGWLIQQQTNHNGGKESEYMAYNFSGQPIKKQQVYIKVVNGIHTTQTEVYTYTYDHAGRPTETRHRLNSGTEYSLAKYTYDELGRLSSVVRKGRSDLTDSYTYNVRSWITKITGAKFSEDLTYQYNGDIASMQWTTGGKTHRYNYSYDGLSRLIAASYTGITTPANYNTAYSYDKHGNIKTLTRYGQTATGTFGIIDNLQLAYTGNQLTGITNAVSSVTSQVAYNKNGALTKDSSKGITNISYNLLNLPNELTINGITNKYTYAADGSKLRVEQGSTVREYTGNKVYENGSLKRILLDGGYIEGGTYHFYLTDHLGNVRVVADQNGTVKQTNEYYPFGNIFAESTGSEQQPYKYNGKELYTAQGLNLYDYHARYYDSQIARFTTIDPLAEKYYSISPYAYVGNNPVSRIDPDGMQADWFQNGGDLIWRPSKEKRITENNITYQNIGSTVSIENNDGTYSNFYQNVGFRSDQPFNAFSYIMGNDLQNKYMSGSSGLWESAKVNLMKATVHQGQQAFLNHPATQFSINAALFVATGGVDGIAGLVNLGKTLLTKNIKNGFTFTKSAAKHLTDQVKHGKNAGQLARPYMNSPLTIQEIMSTGKGVPDATFKGGRNWKVPGTFRGSEGIWELGINPKTKVIYHFNFTK